MKLKYLIQDIIDDKKVGVDGLMINTDDKVFNESRYPSMNKKKVLGRKIGCKDQLHMIEPTCENMNMIMSKGKNEGYKSNIDEPSMIILKGVDSSTQSQPCNLETKSEQT